MKIKLRNSAKRIIALLLLGIILFSFLHSELGFLDYGGNNQACKDYCEIFKDANTHTNILRDNLPKPELDKEICIHCLEEIYLQTEQSCFERSGGHQLVKQSTHIYLFNGTFLI